jgi:hypothetical protein
MGTEFFPKKKQEIPVHSRAKGPSNLRSAFDKKF